MGRGRRPGNPETRAALLRAARRRFAEDGYDRTSLRRIAADVGVDPALVLHFFGSKEALFRAVIQWPFDPDELVARLAAPGPDSLGERLCRAFLRFWEDPATGEPLRAIFRGAVSHEEAAKLIREFLTELVYPRVLPLAGEGGELAVDLVIAQLLGIAVLRHILRVEPVASADLDDLVAHLAPTLDAYLGGSQG